MNRKFSWLLFISIQLALFWRLVTISLTFLTTSLLLYIPFGIHLNEVLETNIPTKIDFFLGNFLEISFILLIPLAISYIYSNRPEDSTASLENMPL